MQNWGYGWRCECSWHRRRYSANLCAELSATPPFVCVPRSLPHSSLPIRCAALTCHLHNHTPCVIMNLQVFGLVLNKGNWEALFRRFRPTEFFCFNALYYVCTCAIICMYIFSFEQLGSYQPSCDKYARGYFFDMNDYDVRRKRLGNMTYDQYLQSPEWIAVRERLTQSGMKMICTICKSHGAVELHHTTYAYIHSASPHTGVIPLCGQCHGRVHQIARARNITIASATNMYRHKKILHR